MQGLIPINVVIGDRSYRVKIEQSDEEAVRRNLKTINDKIVEYKAQFAGKDTQDYIAMVLLWYATQAPEGAAGGGGVALVEALAKMEGQLDKML
jgi:Cell division protein ZapA